MLYFFMTLITLTIIFPNIFMSFQTIFVNHMLMATCVIFDFHKANKVLILFDQVVTSFMLKLIYSYNSKQGLFWQARQKIDMPIGNAIYSGFKKSGLYSAPGDE